LEINARKIQRRSSKRHNTIEDMEGPLEYSHGQAVLDDGSVQANLSFSLGIEKTPVRGGVA
jgi:hypothetical protein